MQHNLAYNWVKSYLADTRNRMILQYKCRCQRMPKVWFVV